MQQGSLHRGQGTKSLLVESRVGVITSTSIGYMKVLKDDLSQWRGKQSLHLYKRQKKKRQIKLLE